MSTPEGMVPSKPGEYAGRSVTFSQFFEGPRVFIFDPEAPDSSARQVPYLMAWYRNTREGEEGDGLCHLVLDQRFGLDLPDDPDLIDRVVHFVADALAIGAGYASFSRTDVRVPFRNG